VGRALHTTPTIWYYGAQRPKAWDVVGQGYVLKSPLTKGDRVNFTYQQGQSSQLGVGISAKGDSSGFQAGGAADGIGFNAQTQTGYDTNGHMTFKFAHKGWLCGTNANVSTAAQLVARGKQPAH
jgi:hypothetical protein